MTKAVLLALSLIIVGSAAAAPVTDPIDDPLGPTCSGRELGLTRLSVATDFAAGFCHCSGDQIGCIEEMPYNFLFSDPDTVVCGHDLLWYDPCVIAFAACEPHVPLECWEMLGWVF